MCFFSFPSFLALPAYGQNDRSAISENLLDLKACDNIFMNQLPRTTLSVYYYIFYTQPDGLPAQLASRRERLGEAQARHEQLSVLIANLKCGVTEHLWQALKKNDKQVRIPPTATKEGHEVDALQRMLKDIENGLVELMKKTG